MHDDGVVVGRLGGDAFMVNREYRTKTIGYFWIVDNVEREQHIVRSHGLTVKPFHVMSEMKRNRLAVGRDLPFLGQPRFRQGSDRVNPDEAFEQIAGELDRARVG